jgi:para-nitrobenzyl esterase
MVGLSRELKLATVLLLASCASAPTGSPPLGGTSWQMVKFQGGDGQVLVPPDRTKYTLAFGENGTLSVRVDCNRGRGNWTSPAPGQVRLGLLAVTRAMCPPDSPDSQIVRQWSYVRSYTVKEGHLYLSLLADGGTYEFEPIAAEQRK